MSVPTTREAAFAVMINNEPFFLAKDERGAPQWHPRQVATQEGDPTRPRRFRWNDWSRGLGDSRGAFRGSVEHCEGAFLGLVGRILPGPQISTIETNHDGVVQCFEEVTLPANRILAGGGTKVVEINPTTHAVAATQTMPGGTVMSMQLFHSQVAIALGDSQQFYRRLADGTYAVSTTTSDSNGDYRYARAFGLKGSSLVRGWGYKWSVCDSADFYAANGNWSADYPIGDPNGKINQVFSHNRWDYVLKDEGLFSFDQDTSEEANLLTDFEVFRSSENRWVTRWHDQLLVCSLAGLYRYLQQGAARPVGAEELELNEGVLQNTFPTAASTFGRWAYVAHYRPSTNTTYLVMHRKAREGDATFGSPVTAVCVIDSFTGRCNAMHLTSMGVNGPEMYYARDTDVSWFELTRDGRPAKYRTSGTIQCDFAPNDLGNPMTIKYARGFEFVGRNASATKTIQWACAFDDGGFNNVGAPVTSLNTFAQRFFVPGVNDSGRVVQPRLTLTNDSETTPPEIRDVVLNYEERPFMTDGALAVFRLRDSDAEGDYSSRLTAKQMREALLAAMDDGYVDVVDPYGNSYKAGLSMFEGEPGYTYEGQEPQESVRVLVRRLDYS